MYCSLDIVFEFFRRDCYAPWHVLFEYGDRDPAVQAELRKELEWARTRSCSRMRGHTSVDLATLSNPYVETFSDMELRHLVEYQKQHPTGCYQMNQNVIGGFGVMSGISKFNVPLLYTLVHHPSFHYSGLHRRWASATEMLLSLGFPVRQDLANVRGSPARCCSFCPGGFIPATADSRTRNKVIGFAGNSQHVGVNVIMKLYVLLFAMRLEQHPVAQVFNPQA